MCAEGAGEMAVVFLPLTSMLENMTNRKEEPMGSPKSTLQWLKNPAATATLRRGILMEVVAKYPEVKVRDWRPGRDR